MCIFNLSTIEIMLDLSSYSLQNSCTPGVVFAKTEVGQRIAIMVMLGMMLLFKCFDRPEVSPHLTFFLFSAI